MTYAAIFSLRAAQSHKSDGVTPHISYCSIWGTETISGMIQPLQCSCLKVFWALSLRWLVVAFRHLKWQMLSFVLFINISTTVHATTKQFVPFCSAQDGEFTNTNCLMFQAYCKNGQILMKRQVYNKDIFHKFWNLLILWNIDIVRVFSWFWMKWYK